LDGAQPVLFCTATLQPIVRQRRLSLPLQMSTPQLSVGPQLERARAQISARAQTASLKAHNSTLCVPTLEQRLANTVCPPSLVPRFRFQPSPSVQDRSCLLLNGDLFARAHAVDGADEGTARDVGLHGCGVMHTCATEVGGLGMHLFWLPTLSTTVPLCAAQGTTASTAPQSPRAVVARRLWGGAEERWATHTSWVLGAVVELHTHTSHRPASSKVLRPR